MISLIVYVVAAFGLAYVIGHSVITKRPREIAWDIGEFFPPIRWLVMLIECPACLGFWIGLAAGFWWPVAGGLFPLSAPLIGAFFTSGSNFILGRLTGLMPSSFPE